MKRREFVLGATSVAGLIYTSGVRAAKPCFPILDGSTGSATCPDLNNNSTLAEDASRLRPGERVDSIALPRDIEEWDISWQNRTAFYDDSRREIQYMGKPQSSVGGRNRSTHHVYSEESNSWRTTSTNVTPNSYGHIWCVTFDHSVRPGDYYHVQHYPYEGDNTRTLLRYNRQADSWGKLPKANFDVWNNSTTPNSGPVFHPNLLGPGQPGIYCFSNGALSYFDVTKETWTLVRDDVQYDRTYGGNRDNGWKHNSSLYIPGLDLAMFGSGSNGIIGGNPHGLFIRAGDADNYSPPVARMPVRVGNEEPGFNSYQMLLDPTDPTQSTVMLLERSGGRVYTSNDPLSGISSWTLQPYQHPFWNNNPYRSSISGEEGSWTCCSISRYGVVLGMGTHSGGGTIMWKPGSAA